MIKSSKFLSRASAVAALMTGLSVAHPAHAAAVNSVAPITKNAPDAPRPESADSYATAPTNRPQASATSANTARSMHGDHGDVETRIKTLHDKLKITPEQESAWNDVAQTMRDNESALEQSIQARHQDPASMNALTDLKSYQMVAQTHVEGFKKLIPVFQTLYDEMSDTQKKNADDVFGRYEGRREIAGGHRHR
ncbi:MAG: Spy/CpxP family protein refolding chaperone [Pseudomonadota bacterium]|nr:Spy/CpxP family protein refolding chaperone [Pseudomonadota bacterium]